jgi:CubicO group peptidase (beta-lactamase class C family)
MFCHYFCATIFLLATISGISTDTNNISKQIDELCSQWNHSDGPGCVVAIARNGKMAYSKGYGIANLDYGIPITSKTVFDIGSMAKQITAACIALLVIDGKLSLDDDIRKHLPKFPERDSPITIEHLIHHTSGIVRSYEVANTKGQYNADIVEADILKYICKQELLFLPGERYKYSNAGYFLLGLIVKRVSGEPLEKFADQRIFKPLGMNNTFYNVDKSQVIKNRAIGYVQNGTGGYRMLHHFNQAPPGGRGVNSTVEDMILWGQNLCKNSIGGKDFLELMTKQGVLNNGDTIDYAFGVNIRKHAGYKTLSHGGYTGSFNTYIIVFPELELTVLFLANTNNMSSGRLGRTIADIYLTEFM